MVYSWPYVDWGGVQIYFLNLIRAAAGEFEVGVALPRDSSTTLLSYLTAEGVRPELLVASSEVRVVRNPWDRLRRRVRKIRVERAVRRHLWAKYDSAALFHVDFPPWTSYRLLSALARRNHTFVTLHTRLPESTGVRSWLWRRRWQKLLRHPKFHLLTANGDVRASLAPHLGPSCESIPIAYSGVDLEQLRAMAHGPAARATLLGELNLPGDRIFVVVAGQFIERKGCWTFVDAAVELSQLDPKLFFLWFGMDTLSDEDARRLDRSIAPSSFRYIASRDSGTTHTQFLETLDVLVDIFVLPSLVEGLPLVLVELMALGKPVVATRINGIPEAIEDGVNGLLMVPGSVPSLTRSIRALAEDPKLRGRLGAAARATACARFDQRLTSETTFAAYRRAVEDDLR